MSVNLKKLKLLLEKHDMIIMEYYVKDGSCYMIKIILMNTLEFVLIYIPSKFRFEMASTENNQFVIEEISDKVEPEDYSSQLQDPNITSIDRDDKATSLYKELIKNYKKNITTEDDEEPIKRKIYRQVKRLENSFKNLNYSVAIQNKNFITISRNNEATTIYSLKNYTHGPKNSCVLFFINLKDFIEITDNIQDDIRIISTQLYDILKTAAFDNLENISHTIKNYSTLFKNIKLTMESDVMGLNDHIRSYKNIREKETRTITNYKETLRNLTNETKKITLERDAKIELENVFKTKQETILKNIKFIEKIYANILTLEQLSFDTHFMVRKSALNVEALEKFYN